MKNLVQMKIMYFFKKMRTGSLIILLVRKILCVTISRGEPSIYFLLNIEYVVYVVADVHAFETKYKVRVPPRPNPTA